MNHIFELRLGSEQDGAIGISTTVHGNADSPILGLHNSTLCQNSPRSDKNIGLSYTISEQNARSTVNLRTPLLVKYAPASWSIAQIVTGRTNGTN